MNALATYCSSLKSEIEGLLPAVERYQSDRITTVHTRAVQEDTPCFILSGKYGFIPAEEPIPYYDHMLQREELDGHIEKVTNQLEESGVQSLHFFSRSPTSDPNLEVYLECIEQACKNAGVSLRISTLKDS